MSSQAQDSAQNPSSSHAGTSAETHPRQPIWLRCEKKPFEHRSALTPTTAKVLLDNNFDVMIERDPQRIFDDEEFEKWVPPAYRVVISIVYKADVRRVGCTLVPHNEWPSAPLDVPIIGLKELPEST